MLKFRFFEVTQEDLFEINGGGQDDGISRVGGAKARARKIGTEIAAAATDTKGKSSGEVKVEVKRTVGTAVKAARK